MKAARLWEFGKPLRLDEIPSPELKTGTDVVIKIAGAGLCHTDIACIDGTLADIRGKFPKLPFTLGHENAGYVQEVGKDVVEFKEGDAVLVYGARGCGVCEFCRRGETQRCNVNPITFGISPEYQGGFAEEMYVPSYENLLKVTGDPTELAPLTDAGLTAYRATRKVQKHLTPGSYSLVIGVGGLGLYAVQYLKLFGTSLVIAADLIEDKLELAMKYGADFALKADASDFSSRIDSITNMKGVKSVLDFVGNRESTQLAQRVLTNNAIYVDVGLGGGSLGVPLMYLIHSESVLTGSNWGTFNELKEVYELAKSGAIKSAVRRVDLSEINDAISLLRKGEIVGRAVLTP